MTRGHRTLAFVVDNIRQKKISFLQSQVSFFFTNIYWHILLDASHVPEEPGGMGFVPARPPHGLVYFASAPQVLPGTHSENPPQGPCLASPGMTQRPPR